MSLLLPVTCPAPWTRVMMGCFWSQSGNKEGPDLKGATDSYVVQSLLAVSHLLSGPEDITVYYLSCRVPKYQPVYQLAYRFCCVYLDTFKVLVCCLGSVRWFPDRQTKHAGGHGKEGRHCLTSCVQMWVWERAREREREKKEGEEKKVQRTVSVTDSSVTHAALQASGWWLIQHNDEPWWINIGPTSRLGLLSLELSEGRGKSSRLWADTEPRWREDTWGICLFISSHMPYPLQCYSESAQWGIRWMLHQLSEDGRAFLPQEQLTQTSNIESGSLKGLGWKRSFFGMSA